MALNPGVRNTLIIVVAFIALVLGLFINRMMITPGLTAEQLKQEGVFVYEPPRKLKDFSLKTHEDKTWTKKDLQSQWTLVFFGFASCPDICPTTMAMLNQAMSTIAAEGKAADTQVVMISVDPARDTVEVLSQYVPYFNKDFTGLTGDFLDILKVANNMNAGFQKIMGENGNYTVDHSAYIFLLNPYGDIHAFFKPPFDADSFARKYLKARDYIDL